MSTMSLFDYMPAARTTDPDTSWEAAFRNLEGRNTDRVAALLLLKDHPAGLTDFELGDRLGRQQTSAGKRRGELRDLGLVEATEVRRPAPSGSNAIVWRITARGHRVACELEAAA